MTENSALRATVDTLIGATNAFDVEAALALFTQDAVIDDPSVGERFLRHAGIRDYLERFFVGYHTVTRVQSVEFLSQAQARVRVDFTGDFGHEIGFLEMSIDADGLIVRIDAHLE
ncbi:nuclear transport factor 2 family protein [Mesorhizobium kowhaii]|uniref:SnoaL-like domain-containing protein n=1 Tax=Mesorhizobium kowhaii TaxID=1300272 RepID=A0A2W7BWS6_9HYPH|nr:nuclear transport factor 2 family protein [Mesorhizobium kowhaii]PZV35270.1 hypothetical protein B5V02_28095 [Mesorhizobium kowhaii]